MSRCQIIQPPTWAVNAGVYELVIRTSKRRIYLKDLFTENAERVGYLIPANGSFKSERYYIVRV